MKPNLVLITVDCLRYDCLFSTGTPEKAPSLTPNIDQLAAHGAFFTNASTGGCWTQAAFPVILTSTYGAMYNGCLGPVAEERPKIQSILKQGGYRTAAVQTSPLLGQSYGWDEGFDLFHELSPRRQSPKWHRMRGIQRLQRQRGFQALAEVLRLETRPAPVYALADEATDAALASLAEIQEPYFFWIHYMDAHWPYYDDEWLQTPEWRARSWRSRQRRYLFSRTHGYQHPGSDEIARWHQMYRESVQRIDHHIGRLVCHFTEMSAAPTFIVLTSDHGEEFLERGRWGHSDGNLYQEILHVPLIMWRTDASQGTRVDRPVSLLDVAPTLLELAGIPQPGAMLGKSLLPLLTAEGIASVPSRPIIAEGRWEDQVYRIALRSDEHKFIVDLRHPDQYELYNLADDPLEQNNLRGQRPGQEQTFRQILHDHLAVVRASEREAAGAPAVSLQVEDRLRDLGYMD